MNEPHRQPWQRRLADIRRGCPAFVRPVRETRRWAPESPAGGRWSAGKPVAYSGLFQYTNALDPA